MKRHAWRLTQIRQPDSEFLCSSSIAQLDLCREPVSSQSIQCPRQRLAEYSVIDNWIGHFLLTPSASVGKRNKSVKIRLADNVSLKLSLVPFKEKEQFERPSAEYQKSEWSDCVCQYVDRHHDLSAQPRQLEMFLVCL